MLQPSGATDAHTVEEFEAAVLAISAAERNRLSAVARSLHGSTGMEPDDLIQEAYTRAFEGRRVWSGDADVVKFLIGAMESIADSSRKGLKVRQFRVVTAGEFSPADTEGIATRTGVLFETRNATPSPEEEAVRREEMSVDAGRLVAWRNELLAAFDDDEQGQLVLMGMMDGLRGMPLREATDLTEEEFPTKYKKVQRRIAALQATRRKP